MRDSDLCGIVNFSTPVLCAKDALGQTANISVKANAGTLTLPSLPAWEDKEDDPLHKPLLGPIHARRWQRGDSLIYWGRPVSYPQGDAIVESALLEVQSQGGDRESCAQQLYNGFQGWLDLFEQYVILFTKQNTHCRVTGHSNTNRIELLAANHGDLRHVARTTPQTICIELSKEDESLHFEQLKEASRLSSLGLSPRLEYRLMLEAYGARRNTDYRKAIIDAATAVEICLTSRALDQFRTQGISFGKGLLQKFRTLSGRFELVRLLGIPVPDKDYIDLVVNPRNNVIHRADFPGKTLANRVITEVEELLRLFSPQLHQDTQEP